MIDGGGGEYDSFHSEYWKLFKASEELLKGNDSSFGEAEKGIIDDYVVLESRSKGIRGFVHGPYYDYDDDWRVQETTKVSKEMLLHYLVFTNPSEFPRESTRYAYIYSSFSTQLSRGALAAQKDNQLYKWNQLKKYIQCYISDRNYEWLAIKNLVQFNNENVPSLNENKAKRFIGIEGYYLQINRLFLAPNFNPNEDSNKGEKYLANDIISYLQECLNFQFHHLNMDYFVSAFAENAAEMEALRENLDFQAQFEDFRNFYSNSFVKLIRNEVMRCLDILFLMFQSQRYSIDTHNDEVFNSFGDEDRVFLFYLERIVGMFEKLIVRPDNGIHQGEPRNCTGMRMHEYARDEQDLSNKCKVCRQDPYSEGCDIDDNPERYKHLLEMSTVNAFDYYVCKGVTSKFLILFSELIGVINYRGWSIADSSYQFDKVYFGKYETMKRNIVLTSGDSGQPFMKTFINMHEPFLSESDSDCLRALIYLMDQNSNFFKYYIKKIGEVFDIDDSYSYSYFCSTSNYPQSYLHISYDSCSKGTYPGVFVSYARIIWLNVIDFVHKFMFLTRKDALNSVISDEHLKDLLQLCEFCFTYDPDFLKESFWMCFKKGLSYAKINWHNVTTVSNMEHQIEDLFDKQLVENQVKFSKLHHNKDTGEYEIPRERLMESDYSKNLYFPLTKRMARNKNLKTYLFDRSVKSILYLMSYLLHSRTRIRPLLVLLSYVIYDFKSAKLTMDILSLKHEVPFASISQHELLYLVTGNDGKPLFPANNGKASFEELKDFIDGCEIWRGCSEDEKLPRILPGLEVELCQHKNFDGESAVKNFSRLEPHNGIRGFVKSYDIHTNRVSVDWNLHECIDYLDLVVNSIIKYNYCVSPDANDRQRFTQDLASSCEYSICLVTKILQYYDDEEGYVVEIDNPSDPKKSRVFKCKLEYRNKFSSLEFEDYANSFAVADADGSGAIDMPEMEKVFEHYGCFKNLGIGSNLVAKNAAEAEQIENEIKRQKQAKVEELYVAIDKDGNGEIDFDEYLQFMISIKFGTLDVTDSDFQDLIHTELQDSGIVNKFAKRFKKCISPIHSRFVKEIREQTFTFSKPILDSENIYFVASIFNCFQMMFYGRALDFASARSSMKPAINPDGMYGLFDEQGKVIEDKLMFFNNFLLFLNECCNNILELQTDLSMFLIGIISSNSFLSDMRLIQKDILSRDISGEGGNMDSDAQADRIFEIEIATMYELVRLIGGLFVSIIEHSNAKPEAMQVSGADDGKSSSSSDAFSRYFFDKRTESEKIIDFFFDLYYSFSRFDFGVNFTVSSYSSRHRLISLCIDILEKVTKIQTGSSHGLNYLLDKLFTMDSRGIRGLNWLLNTALNPILCRTIHTDDQYWWNSFDVSDAFAYDGFIDKDNRLTQVVSGNLLKEIVMVSTKSTSFIIHLLDLAAAQTFAKRPNNNIFSVITDLFSSALSFVCIYENRPVTSNLLIFLCKLIEIKSRKLGEFNDKIKFNGITLLNSVLKILSRQNSKNSLAFIITTSIHTIHLDQMKNLAVALADIFIDDSYNYATISAAIDFLILIIHSNPVDINKLFLVDISIDSTRKRFILIESLIELIRESPSLYRKEPKILYNVQRLILAMIKNLHYEDVNKVLFAIVFPSSTNPDCDYEKPFGTFWDCICCPLSFASDIEGFDFHKIDLIRQLVPSVSEINNNHNDFDSEEFQDKEDVEFKDDAGIWTVGKYIIPLERKNMNDKELAPGNPYISYVKRGDLQICKKNVNGIPLGEIRKLSFEKLSNETVIHCYKLSCHAMALELLTEEHHGALKELGKYSYVDKCLVKVLTRDENMSNGKQYSWDLAHIVNADLISGSNSKQVSVRYGAVNDIHATVEPEVRDVEEVRHVRFQKHDKDNKYRTIKEEVMAYMERHQEIFVKNFRKTSRIYSKVSPMFVKSLDNIDDDITDRKSEDEQLRFLDNLVDSIYCKMKVLKKEAKTKAKDIDINLDVNLFTYDYSSSAESNYWPILSQDICTAPSTLYMKSFLVPPKESSTTTSDSTASGGGAGSAFTFSAPGSKPINPHFSARHLPDFGKDYFYNTGLFSNYTSCLSLYSIQTIQDIVVDMTACNVMWSLLDSQSTLLQCYKRFVQVIVPHRKLHRNNKGYVASKKKAQWDDSDSESESGMNTPDSSCGYSSDSGYNTPGYSTPGGLFTPDGLQTPDSGIFSRSHSGGSGGGGSSDKRFPGRTRCKIAIDELLDALIADLTRNKKYRDIKRQHPQQSDILADKEKMQLETLGEKIDKKELSVPAATFELFVLLQKFELLLSMINYRLSDSLSDKYHFGALKRDIPNQNDEIKVYLQKVLNISKFFSLIHYKKLCSDNKRMVTVLYSLTGGKLLNVILILLQTLMSDEKTVVADLVISIFDIADMSLKDNFDQFGIRVLCKKSKYISKIVGTALSQEDRESIDESLLQNFDSLELNDSCGGDVTDMCLQLMKSCISILYKDHSAAGGIKSLSNTDAVEILSRTSILVRRFCSNWAPILAKLSVDDCLYVHDYENWDIPEIQNYKNEDDDEDGDDDEYAIENMQHSKDDSKLKKDKSIFSSKKKSRDNSYNVDDVNNRTYRDMFRRGNLESLVEHLKGLNGSSALHGISEVVLVLIQSLNSPASAYINTSVDKDNFVDIDSLLMEFFESVVSCPLIKAYKQITLTGAATSDGQLQDKTKVRTYSSVYMGYDLSEYESPVCEYWKRVVSFSTEMVYRYCPLVRPAGFIDDGMRDRVVTIVKHFLHEFHELLLLPLTGLSWKYYNSLQQCKLSSISMHFFSMISQRIPSLKLEFKSIDAEIMKTADRTLCFLTKTFFCDDKKVKKVKKDSLSGVVEEALIERFQTYYLRKKFKPYSKFESKYLSRKSHILPTTLVSKVSEVKEWYKISSFLMSCEHALIELFEVVVHIILGRTVYNILPTVEMKSDAEDSSSSSSFSKSKNSSSNSNSISGGGGVVLGSSSNETESLPLGTRVFYYRRKTYDPNDHSGRKLAKKKDFDELPPWGFIQRSSTCESLYHIMRCNAAGDVIQLDASVPSSDILNKPQPLLKISEFNRENYPHRYFYRASFYSEQEDGTSANAAINMTEQQIAENTSAKSLIDTMFSPKRLSARELLHNGDFDKTPHHQRPRQGSNASIGSAISRASSFDSSFSDQGAALSGKKRVSSIVSASNNIRIKSTLSKGSKKFVDSTPDSCSIELLLSSLIYLTGEDTYRYKIDTLRSIQGEFMKIFESKVVYKNFQLTFFNLTLSLVSFIFNELCFYWEVFLFFDDSQEYKDKGSDYGRYCEFKCRQFANLDKYTKTLVKCIKDMNNTISDLDLDKEDMAQSDYQHLFHFRNYKDEIIQRMNDFNRTALYNSYFREINEYLIEKQKGDRRKPKDSSQVKTLKRKSNSLNE